jgi:transposase InsO family protein
MDVAQLPRATSGEEYLLIITDAFTGFLLLFPLHSISHHDIARCLWKWISIIGPPRVIRSDYAGDFISQVVQAMLSLHGIQYDAIAPYYPRAVGGVESPVGSVKKMIIKSLYGDPQHWPVYSDSMKLWINLKIKELRGASPFSLMFARPPTEFSSYLNESLDLDIDSNEWRRHQDEVLSLVYPAIDLRAMNARQQYVDRLDAVRHRVLKENLPPDTPVMVRDPRSAKDGSKLPYGTPLYLPQTYFIVRRHTNGGYVLRDESFNEYNRVVPLPHLKVLKSRHYVAPKLDQWIVDEIRAHRGSDADNLEYLIKWKGYPTPTWEPRKNILDPALVRQYHLQHPFLPSSSSSSSTPLRA